MRRGKILGEDSNAPMPEIFRIIRFFKRGRGGVCEISKVPISREDSKDPNDSRHGRARFFPEILLRSAKKSQDSSPLAVFARKGVEMCTAIPQNSPQGTCLTVRKVFEI